MSEIKVNSIKGVGASTAAITVNNTDGTATANLTNIGGGQLSNRNLIINGDMKVAQRGTSSTTVGYQTVDRFTTSMAGTDEAVTFAQVDVASGTTPYTQGFRKAFKLTNGNQTSGAGAADDVSVSQYIESQYIAQSGWDYTSSSSFITLSFWVRSSVAQTFFCGMRLYGSDQREFCFSYTLSANTWTKVTKSIPGAAGLTILNDNTLGAFIQWPQFWGTNYTSSGRVVDTWQVKNNASNYPDYTSTWYTTNDATWELTGVQLEVGSVATDFEHRSITDEIIRCERYYRRDDADGQVYYRFAQGQCTSSTGSQYVVKFPVRMRAAPTLATSGTITAYTVNSQKTTGTISIGDATTQGCIISANASGFSAGNCVDLIASGDGNAYVEFIAEL
tara:strand:- start:202 stop:1371 length:1170 start_codon:yes stop_codon:yes gene_type:complete